MEPITKFTSKTVVLPIDNVDTDQIIPARFLKGTGKSGWGEHEAMMNAIEAAVSRGPFLLGDMFSIADVVFGGTLRYMARFKMLAPSPAVADYIARLSERPALQRADARNQEVAKAHGLTT